MNTKLIRTIDNNTEDLLFDEQYDLEFKYSLWGYLRLIVGMTAIPTKVNVFKNQKKHLIGSIKEETILSQLAY